MTPVTRLSVSAVRDWNKCSWYYKLNRVDKISPDKTGHQRWAGSLMHAAFMLAYGRPDAESTKKRGEWIVDNAGSIEDALELFEMLWEGESIPTGYEDTVGLSRAQQAYQVLSKDEQLRPVDARHFSPGTVKALKNPNLTERKRAYKEYFREMLETSLVEGLGYPVVALEHEVNYQMGGVPMLGYIDLVLRRGDGGLVFVDLKTGVRCPSEHELAFDDQMASYYGCTYQDQLPAEVWFHHMKSGTIQLVPQNLPYRQQISETVPLIKEQIEAGQFVKRITSDCAKCDFRRSCLGI